MSLSDSKTKKLQDNFTALSSLASELNAATDEFTTAVGLLDERLKKLNLGLTVWVRFRDHSIEDVPARFDEDQIGYAKVQGKWGIALRRVWGDAEQDFENEEGPWLFREGPRDMRVHSVDAIPELVNSLGREALELTRKVRQKTKEVETLAAAISPTAELNVSTVSTAAIDELEALYGARRRAEKGGK